MGDVEELPPGYVRPTRAGRVGYAVATLGFVCGTVFLLWQGGSATWDALMLAVRGEVVSARVVEVDLHTKMGMADELDVVPAGTTIPVEISTFREDIPVGAVVDVVVDPADPTRADLESDGWPWLATTMPFFIAPFAALLALLMLGFACGQPVYHRELDPGAEDPDEPASASDEPTAVTDEPAGGATRGTTGGATRGTTGGTTGDGTAAPPRDG
ncbi:DUF3592 domain-containing protein [Actinomycetospora straminea]|nr:DUF3592 domain-containing protein [Actinomycetospora straminea]MDD7931588.1 hypothetical protein [Actinomycetospora straminea]